MAKDESHRPAVAQGILGKGGIPIGQSSAHGPQAVLLALPRSHTARAVQEQEGQELQEGVFTGKVARE